MIRRLAIFVIAALGLATLVAAPAGAHVTVDADDATPGGYAVVTFRVPNETSDATTVGLRIQLPVDHPIANVALQPKPGWTAETTVETLDEPIDTGHGTVTEAVTEIEWTGGEIAPGEFDQFLIQAGPLPTGTESLTFKAIQTYRDSTGETSEVAWIEEPVSPDDQPEHPAPVLALTGGDDTPVASGSTGATEPAAADQATDTGTETAADDQAEDDASDTALVVLAMAIGAAGLVMAIAALVLAVAARQKMTMAMDRPWDDDDG